MYFINCVSGGWKPALEQSAADITSAPTLTVFSEPPKNLPLFPIISFLTVFGLVLYTVYSSNLAVLYLSRSE